MYKIPDKDRIRLLKHRFITENDCWEWTKNQDPSGYGRITVQTIHGSKNLRTHRYALFLLNGIELNPDDIVHHKCRNRMCFNPDHLEVTSTSINNIERSKDWDEFRQVNAELVAEYEHLKFAVAKAYREWHKEVD